MASLGGHGGCDYWGRRTRSAWRLAPAFLWLPGPGFGEEIRGSPPQTCVCLGLISKSHLPHLDVVFKAFPTQPLIFIKGKSTISLKKHSQGFSFPGSLGWASRGGAQGEGVSSQLKVAGAPGGGNLLVSGGRLVWAKEALVAQLSKVRSAKSRSPRV